MLTVKANNGELKEMLRFQKLARDDLKNNLDKKKMKTLIPQAVRATYIGGLLLLCAGSIVVSGTSFHAEGFLSFLTALALVVEPIQVSSAFYVLLSYSVCWFLTLFFLSMTSYTFLFQNKMDTHLLFMSIKLFSLLVEMD